MRKLSWAMHSMSLSTVSPPERTTPWQPGVCNLNSSCSLLTCSTRFQSCCATHLAKPVPANANPSPTHISDHEAVGSCYRKLIANCGFDLAARGSPPAELLEPGKLQLRPGPTLSVQRVLLRSLVFSLASVSKGIQLVASVSVSACHARSLAPDLRICQTCQRKASASSGIPPPSGPGRPEGKDNSCTPTSHTSSDT